MIFLFAVSISAQTTVFTYQGKLTDNGIPQAIYQMEFRLFGSAGGSDQIGATVTNTNVAVNQGVFTVNLDFGAAAFSGADRFLQISVRRSTNESFITLNPRQQITSSPYSIRTLSAAQADFALDSNKLGGVDANQYVTTSSVGNSFIRNSTTQQAANFNISGSGIFGGSVGIRTNSPQSPLSVFAADYGFTQTDGNVIVGSFVSSASTFGTGAGWYGTRSNHPLSFFTNDSSAQMTVATNGNVGIGTGVSSPATRLALNGGPVWTSNGWAGSLSMGNASAIGWEPNASGQRFGIGQSIGGLYFFHTNSAFGTTGSPANYDMTITDTGNVGIGTTTPNNHKLFINGGVGQPAGSYGLPKFMLLVRDSPGTQPTIERCYNTVSASSIVPCGLITIGQPGGSGPIGIRFPFRITDRFFSLTPIGSPLPAANQIFFDSGDLSGQTLFVQATNSGDSSGGDADFYLIVF